MADPIYLTRRARELADEGKVIEAGWTTLRISVFHPDTPPVILEQARHTFFAGAFHLWSVIFTVLEGGTLETDMDMQRMTRIQQELDRFMKQYKEKYGIKEPKPH